MQNTHTTAEAETAKASRTPNFDKLCNKLMRLHYSKRVRSFLKNNKKADIIDVLNDLNTLHSIFSDKMDELDTNLLVNNIK